MSGLTIINLPEPPSVNRLYGVGKGGQRYRNSEYDSWLSEAGWEVKIRPRMRIASGPYKILIEISEKSRKDADNTIKAVLDFLVKMGVTPDDKHCVKATVVKCDWIDRGKCRVIIAEAA